MVLHNHLAIHWYYMISDCLSVKHQCGGTALHLILGQQRLILVNHTQHERQARARIVLKQEFAGQKLEE
jgi:hypothetical protein